MPELISILYAHRNRDLQRIKISFDSLSRQSVQDFEVIFIDYGSESQVASELRSLSSNYKFVKFFPLPVQQLLWNKSKALNYGILKSGGDYIFIGDVDLVFHPDAIKLMRENINLEHFQLLTLSYLNKQESSKLYFNYDFEEIKPYRSGDVNGMVLASKEAFLKINGFDEFFHFYGAEDVDLFSRFENAGYREMKNTDCFFYHNWHPGFQGSDDSIVTRNPRIKNIMRINQQHYFRNKKLNIIRPLRQSGMGTVIGEKESERLDNPSLNFTILNIAAQVDHFLEEQLPSLKNEVIKAVFVEDPYYNSLKYKIKVKMGKQTQPYYSLKEVNDRVLKKILFLLRDENYSFKISENLDAIELKLEV